MKKYNIYSFYLYFLLLSLILLGLSGCENNETTYELLHDKSEISNIYLVPVDNVDAENVTCDLDNSIEITNVDEFVSELNKLTFYKHMFGDPENDYSDTAVYILYSNGDREFIHHQVQNCINNGEVIYRRLTCDMASFDNLLRVCFDMAED